MTCGVCGLPIHESETGLRYFGFYTGHSAPRCIQLLRLEIDKARQEEREQCAKIAESWVIWTVHHGWDSEEYAAEEIAAKIRGGSSATVETPA